MGLGALLCKMGCNNLSNWISAIAVVVSAGTAIFALIKTSKIAKQSNETAVSSLLTAKQSLETTKQQTQVSLFMEFTRRYQKIMFNLLKGGGEKKYYQTLYIDLCSEEYYMQEQGYLLDKVWEIWEEGIEHEVKHHYEDYYEIWREHKGDYSSGFQEFFDKIICDAM